jgi:hypothetical protein
MTAETKKLTSQPMLNRFLPILKSLSHSGRLGIERLSGWQCVVGASSC